jgi:polyhydroxybutyrate depolymerase
MYCSRPTVPFTPKTGTLFLMKPLSFTLALIVIVLIVAACDKAREARQAAEPAAHSAVLQDRGSAGCGSSASTGNSTGLLMSDGLERGFRLHIPDAYAPSTPAALVLNFHGLGSNAVQQELYSGLIGESDEAGFIVATPEGSGNPQRWYFIDLPGAEVDDFAFVRALIGHLSDTLCIDPSRVYATGMSNGGFMSSALACEMSDTFAAVAPVAGVTYLPSCEGKRPVPIVIFHGTNDAVVPFAGGNIGLVPAALPGVRETAGRWAQHNGCGPMPDTERIASDVALERYAGCSGGAGVHLYVIEGGGHTWPGALPLPFLDKTTQSIKAAEIIWRFFSEHSK